MVPNDGVKTEHTFYEYVDAGFWQQYYEAAIAEQDPDLRVLRIAEAKTAIFQRATELEESQACDAECQSLEEAATILVKNERSTRSWRESATAESPRDQPNRRRKRSNYGSNR